MVGSVFSISNADTSNSVASCLDPRTLPPTDQASSSSTGIVTMNISFNTRPRMCIHAYIRMHLLRIAVVRVCGHIGMHARASTCIHVHSCLYVLILSLVHAECTPSLLACMHIITFFSLTVVHSCSHTYLHACIQNYSCTASHGPSSHPLPSTPIFAGGASHRIRPASSWRLLFKEEEGGFFTLLV